MKVSETEPKEPSLWDKTKGVLDALYRWMLRYPIALILSVLVILGVAIALMLGVGDRFNVGGIIGKLFGKKKSSEDRVVVANKVPEDRVDEDGETIPVGEADDNGIVQREVEVLEQSKNPFRDKSKIKVKTPEGQERDLDLPKGVEDTEVDKVFQVQPKVFKVEVQKRPEGRVSDDDLKYLE